MAYGAFVIVALTAELLPEPAVAKIDALIFRRVDVIRPKKADVAVLKRMLRGDKAKSHVDVVRGRQLQPRPAFEEESGRGRLMQFGRRVGELLELHGSVARLKENRATIVVITLVTVENVLEIETRDTGDEQIGRLGAMLQTPDAVVAGPVLARRRVVADHRGQIPGSKCVMSHRRSSFFVLALDGPDEALIIILFLNGLGQGGEQGMSTFM